MSRTGLLPALALALLTACDREAAPMPDVVVADTLTAAEQAGRTAELLAPVRSVSIAQVDFGNLAMQRAVRDDVRRYGEVVGADHRALVAVIDSMAQAHGTTIEETIAARDLANSTRMAHAGLENLAGEDFDLAFIRAQVESHRQLLDRLDHELIPASDGARVSSVLRDVRSLADAHLARGRQLLADLLGEPSPEDPAAPAPGRSTPAPPGTGGS